VCAGSPNGFGCLNDGDEEAIGRGDHLGENDGEGENDLLPCHHLGIRHGLGHRKEDSHRQMERPCIHHDHPCSCHGSHLLGAICGATCAHFREESHDGESDDQRHQREAKRGEESDEENDDQRETDCGP
jgi:hypothetical protein